MFVFHTYMLKFLKKFHSIWLDMYKITNTMYVHVHNQLPAHYNKIAEGFLDTKSTVCRDTHAERLVLLLCSLHTCMFMQFGPYRAFLGMLPFSICSK